MRSVAFPVGFFAGVLTALIVIQVYDDQCGSGHNGVKSAGPKNWYQEVEEADLNPVMRLGKRRDENYTAELIRLHKQQVRRPRFYAIELNLRNNLFVGIVSTEHSLPTLGAAVNSTFLPHADKVTVFLDSKMPRYNDQVPSNVVMLSDYSQHAQSSSVLQKLIAYLDRNHTYYNLNIANSFNWFLFTADNVYLYDANFKQLLDNLTISQPLLVVPDNYHCQNILNYELTAPLLMNYKFLANCSDIDCIFIHCLQQSKAVKRYSTYQLIYDASDELELHKQALLTSVATYPIYTSQMYYSLHRLATQHEIVKTHSELEMVEDELSRLDEIEYDRFGVEVDDNEDWPLGIAKRFKPSNRFSVIRWTVYDIASDSVLMPNDDEVRTTLTDVQREEIAEIRQSIVEYCTQHDSIDCANVRIDSLKTRLDATRGQEYLVDAVFRDSSGRETVKYYEVLKPLNPIELLPGVPYTTEHKRILITVPVHENELEAASSFLTHYSHVCLKKSNHQTSLVLLLMYNSSNVHNQSSHDVFASLKTQADFLDRKYKPNSKLIWVSFRTTRKMSQLAYLDLLSSRLPSDNILILHMKPNVQITFEFLNRVRMNTIPNYQVFFPIPFVEYQLVATENDDDDDDDLGPLNVATDNGYFDDDTFDHCSFYVVDYIAYRRKVTSIPLAKSEADYARDLDAWDVARLFIERDAEHQPTIQLNIIRAVEPELKERFFVDTKHVCDHEINEFARKSCDKRRLHSIGRKSQLASLVTDDTSMKPDPNYS